MGNIGRVLSTKTDNAVIMDNLSSQHNLHRNGNNNNVLGNIHHSFFHHFFSLSKEMGQAPIALKIFLILGWSVTGIGILLDSPIGQQIISEMPLGFQYSIDFFSCVFLLIQCARTYQKLRKEKMANDEAYMNYRDRKQAHDAAKLKK